MFSCKDAVSFTAEAVLKMAELYRQRLVEIRNKILISNRLIEVLSKDLTKAKNELEEKKRKGQSGMEFAILVDIEAIIGGNASFTFKYIVPNASWKTSYDLRVKDINHSIELITKAEVAQSSGEDWKMVQLTFSTGNPNRNTTPPKLKPWWLQLIENQPIYMEGSRNKIEMMDAVIVTDKEETNVRAPQSVSPQVNAQENITVLEWKVKESLTIPSDNKQHTVQIQSSEIIVSYHYRVVPSRDLKAYLIGSILDWHKYNLSAAQANIYFEGTFVGQTLIQASETSDTLEISLGQDIAISVNREKIIEYSKTKILSNKKLQTVGWKLEVRNNKSVPIELEIIDQVPLSSNSEINIEVKKLSGGIQDNNTGIVIWIIQLLPGERKLKELMYSVKSPKDKRINF